MNKKLFGTLFLVGGLLAGCGEANVQKVDDSAGSKTKTEQPGQKEAKKTKFKIGETVSIDGMEVTINKVSWGKTIAGVPAQKGKVLRIEGSAKNNAAENGFIDNSEFQVYAGDIKTESYFGNDDANMLAGELKKGKSAPIVLEFDVPEAESYEIFYEPSFTLKDNAEVKWTVTKGEIK